MAPLLLQYALGASVWLSQVSPTDIHFTNVELIHGRFISLLLLMPKFMREMSLSLHQLHFLVPGHIKDVIRRCYEQVPSLH
jgi:hypothetical protein